MAGKCKPELGGNRCFKKTPVMKINVLENTRWWVETDGAEIWRMRGWKEMYMILGQFFKTIPSLVEKGVTEFVG